MEANKKFKEFCQRFNKTYDDPEIYEQRRNIYLMNYLGVAHQAGSSLMQLNHMADWSHEEYQALLGVFPE